VCRFGAEYITGGNPVWKDLASRHYRVLGAPRANNDLLPLWIINNDYSGDIAVYLSYEVGDKGNKKGGRILGN
jgi:hypothetical protein